MMFRHWIRIIGIAFVGFGLLYLPSIGRSPQSYGSGFAILSDTSSLLWMLVARYFFLALLSAAVGHDEITPNI